MERRISNFGDCSSMALEIYLCLQRRREKKCKRKVQEVQVRAKVEKGGEAIFGLYLFLKRKEEGKLEEF